ncbi:MAG: TetR/AcrR family transcriptional regulator [Sphingobium sp.]
MKAKESGQTAPQLCEVESHTLSDVTSHRLARPGSSRGIDPRQQRSAEALRGGLLRLLERKSFDQIMIKEICKEAGVHNATFHRHYVDKDALLHHVAKDEIDRLVAFSLPSGHGLEGYRVLCNYVRDHRTLWRALLNGGAGATMREQYVHVSRSVAADYKMTQSWLPHDLSVICSTVLIIETISWWLSLDDGDEESCTCDELAVMLDKLVSATVTGATRKKRKARAPAKD